MRNIAVRVSDRMSTRIAVAQVNSHLAFHKKYEADTPSPPYIYFPLPRIPCSCFLCNTYERSIQAFFLEIRDFEPQPHHRSRHGSGTKPAILQPAKPLIGICAALFSGKN